MGSGEFVARKTQRASAWRELTQSSTHIAGLGRLFHAARDEAILPRSALGLVALHAADDNWLQPNPGTSARDHLLAGLVPVALLLAAIAFYPRLRPGARAVVALAGGFLGVLFGSEAAYYTISVGPSGDDFTGVLAIGAGLLLFGVGGVTLWQSRRRDDARWWRYSRRLVFLGAAYLVASVLLMPFAVAYVLTHTARAQVAEANLGAPYENVVFRTSDGLRLAGWYIRSHNRAAVILSAGRSGTQSRARLLARHGYGVLLFDRRGEGDSEGDPNVYGWHGVRDIHAGVKFLQSRPDVDPGRIGGIGLSVGGEMLIEAAAQSRALRAIVSEGASGRSVRDDLANPDSGLETLLGDGVTTLATALFTDDLPPPTLKSLVPKIHGAAFFVYGERGQPAERPANAAFYAEAHDPKQLWEVPGARHTGGLDASPRAYERRVIAFLDRYLLPGSQSQDLSANHSPARQRLVGAAARRVAAP